jgi:hypothetical protein
LIYGFQIKAANARGGFVENVSVKDCALRKITVFSSVGYNNDGKPAPVTPYFKNLKFSDIDMRMAEDPAVIIVQGFPEISHYTQNVTFENIMLPENAVVSLNQCKDVKFAHVLTVGKKKPAYKIDSSVDINY